MADDSLNWLFELDANTTGAEKMLGVLGSLDSTLKKLDANMKTVEHGSLAAGVAHAKHGHEAAKTTGFLKAMEAAFRPLEEHFKRVGEFELFRRVTDKILEFPEKLIDKVKELGEEMLHVAAEAEEMSITFKALFGAEDGEKLLGYADALSEKTGILNDQWKGIEQTLGNAGFKIGPDMQRAAEAISDMGALSGRGAAGAAEAAEMFSRLQSLGQIHPKMLASFGLNVDSFWTELSKQTHKGVTTLKKEMTKGKVDIEYTKAAIEQLIVAKTHKGLGGLGADIGEDLMSRLRRFQNLPKLLFEGVKDTSGYKAISDSLARAFDALNPKGVAGKQIFEGLASAFSRVGNAIGAIDWPEVAGDIGKVVDVVGIFVAGGIEFADQLVRGFVRVVDMFEGIPGSFDDAWTSIGENLIAAGKWIGGLALDAGKALWFGLLDGIAGGVTKVLDAIGGLGEAMVLKLKGVLGIHSPSLVFKHMGAMSSEGYALGLEQNTPHVRRAAYDVATPEIPAASTTFSTSTRRTQGGPVTVNCRVDISLDGTGKEGAGLADDIRSRLRALLPSELQSAFEQIALEGGG